MKVFHRKLYFDMLRQQRLMGFLFMALCCVITAVGIGINYIPIMDSSLVAKQAVPQIESSAAILVAFVFLGVIALVYQAFSFLNKRTGSDFYHSLPLTRTSIFFSMAASVATWVFFVIAATLAVEGLGYLLTGMPYDYGYLPMLLLFYFVTSLCVMSAALMAVSITGTRFSNIILTGLILFLPRFLLTMAAAGIIEKAQIITANDFGILLNYSYHTPVALILSPLFGGFFGTQYGRLFSNFAGIGYTFLLSIVQVALALLFFHRRKSEMADKSAPNAFLQRLYQCACGLPVLIIAVVVSSASGSGSIITVCVVISLILYFGFEVITTKSAKKMLLSAPYYLAVVAVTLLFSLGINVGASSALSVQPEADEIKSISFGSSSSYYGKSPYLELILGDVAIEDEEAFAIVSSSLKSTVTFVQGDRYHAYDPNIVTDLVSIHLKNGGQVTRSIRFPAESYSKLTSILQESEAYRDALYQLPTDNEITSLDMYPLTTEQVQALLDSYREEYKTLPLEVVLEGLDQQNQTNLGTFYVIGTRDYERFVSYYTITPQLPKTAQMFMAFMNDNDITNTLGMLDTIALKGADAYTSASITVQPLVKQDTTVNMPCEVTQEDDCLQEIAQILKTGSLTSQITPTTLCVRIGTSESPDYIHYQTEIYLLLDEASFQRLMELVK